MKNGLMLALACFAMLTSCKKESTETPETEPTKIDSLTTTDAEVGTQQECYEFVQQKDTIAMSYEQDGANVTGNLRFKNYEKDSSTGPVTGTFTGDTLKLSYTLQSEGMTSVRDVYFLKNAKTLIMGAGDMKEVGGKQAFTSPNAIKYDKSIVLVKTDCE